MIALLFLFLCASAVFAEGEYLEVGFYGDGSGFSSITTGSRNAFYVLFQEYNDDVYDFIDDAKTVQLIDDAGNVLYSESFTSPWFAPYYANSARIKVVSDEGDVLLDTPLTLCNKNNVCEPCEGDMCSVAENSMTCSDCASGSFDGFCDLKEDGVCDPDCSMIDGDCRGCYPDCFFDYMDDFSCDALGGTVCELNDECVGGEFRNTEGDPVDSCCVGGTCRNTEEYIEAKVALENQPSMTYTPSGELASVVEEQGIGDYCIGTLKGNFCGPEEHCQGEEVEFYYDTFCCIGSCVIDPDVLKEEEMAEAGAIAPVYEEVAPMTPEEAEQYYGFGDLDDKAIEDLDSEELDPDLYDIDSDDPEPAHEAMSEVGEAPPLFSAETFDDVKEKAENALSKISMVHVAGIILGVLILVFVLVAIFRRGAAKKVGAEVSLSPTSLQSEIDALASQGNDYKHIEQILVGRGFDKSLVDVEIKKNYDKRVEMQRMAGKGQ